MKFFYESVVASSISNMIGIVVGHPLDTIKVRMQMSSENPGLTKVLSETFKAEGIRGFFKGATSPLSAAVPYCSWIFTINEMSKRKLDTFGLSEANKSFISGGFSGALGMVFYVPVEVLKCRAQIVRDQHLTLRQLLPIIVKNEGIGALYRGFAANCIRDIPGWALYFYSYELFKDLSHRFCNQYMKPSHHPKGRDWMINVNSGGWAGVFSWLMLYPFDIVKTHIQLSKEAKAPKIADVFRQQYKEHGVSYFFRGLKATLIRAYPVNALTLSSFDYINERITKD